MVKNQVTVPFLNLKEQHQNLKDSLMTMVEEIVGSQQFVLGARVKDFEEKCAEYCDSKYSVGVSSGTDALLMALMASGIGTGDEVITTNFSFFATAGTIWRTGAKPVFVDIESETFNLDISQLEAKITNKTKAIMPVHLYGLCADMDAINEIARKHNLVVIEDAAQAFGSKYKGRAAGSLGDFGCFSFYPTKNLGGIGDGGLITLQDEDNYNKLLALRNHGDIKACNYEYVGGNFRLDALQAGALQIKLDYISDWNEKRRQNAADYEQLFSERGLDSHIRWPKPPADCISIYHQYTIWAPKRDELRTFLSEKGIGSALYYPYTLHAQPCFSDLGYSDTDFPVSIQASKETLALPIFSELTMEQKEHVANSIQEFYQQNGS